METVIVMILEPGDCRLGTSLDDEAALTLVAVAGEDPACWDDIVAYWPRHRTPPVPEFADGLALETVDHDAARRALDGHESWFVIDLVRKRIVTGRSVDPIGRDAAFAMVVDESGKQHCPLSIHLPPWWELFEQADPSAIDREREQPLSVPRVNRDVLFGDALTEDLARRILDVVSTDAWRASNNDKGCGRYGFTVQVHRDWLMTPRSDLGGRIPRQLLHGGIKWIDRLADAQRLRFQDGGEIVAAPTNVTGYDEAPMGREEMALYFDLCRELIDAGWEWCISRELESQAELDRPRVDRALAAFLVEVQQQWLTSPFEDGSPPQFILECSRRRVPRGAGVPIVGMTEREAKEHLIDCNCPLCNMSAEGLFGPAFAFIDGHHLELDDEFAFSMHETREAWEEQQREFAEMSAEIDRKQAECEARGETEPDPFDSAWSGNISDEPLPGDPQGHVKLAFLLAEVVGLLELSGASQDELQQLNERFTDFRRSDRADLAACSQRLSAHLEDVVSRFPELVSRVADLQSRIDEQVRFLTFDDFPF